VLVHQGPAGDSNIPHPGAALDARTLEHAAQSLEEFLTQPRKIQE
jgi:hypothetical protein